MYKNRLSFFPPALYGHTYTVILLLFLAVIGSHFLDYHLFGPIIVGLFLVKWERLPRFHTLLVTLFLLSIYITWVFLDPRLLHQAGLAEDVFSRGILVWLMYLIGLSIPFKTEKNRFCTDRRLFYILFILVITYCVITLMSAIVLQQDHPLTDKGMFVLFPNSYQMAQVNGGRLISTILAYYLTMATLLITLILLFYRQFRKQGFYILELAGLLLLSGGAFYLTVLMSRRTTLVLLILALLFLLFLRIFNLLKTHRVSPKKFLFIAVVAGTVLFLFNTQKKEPNPTNHSMANIESVHLLKEKLTSLPVIHRLMHQGFKDSRFSRWSAGLKVIRQYPLGGGYDVYVGSGFKLAHNTWIDIGKDLGVIPFILFIMITLLHLYYLLYIFFASRVEALLKSQLVLMAIGIFPIMMIEPVFNSDKTFFAYIFFYFGVLANLYLKLHERRGRADKTTAPEVSLSDHP